MTVVLNLELSEGLYFRLMEQAERLGQPPEVWALHCLEAQIQHQAEDPISKFIGAFNSGVADLGMNHDKYVRQGLLGKLEGRDQDGGL